MTDIKTDFHLAIHLYVTIYTVRLQILPRPPFLKGGEGGFMVIFSLLPAGRPPGRQRRRPAPPHPGCLLVPGRHRRDEWAAGGKLSDRAPGLHYKTHRPS